MPIVIRKVVNEHYENFIELAPEEWRLREQVEALEQWLCEDRRGLDPKYDWVADIGFCMRVNARGGGPVISKELMRMCLEVNLQIFLSEYPGTAEPAIAHNR